MIQVAILGHGVVGSGVAEVLRQNHETITHKAGDSIEIKRILDLRSFPDLPYASLFTTSFDEILNDPDIRIVVETMGGLHPAYDYVKACRLTGKSVVTSNKELVAACGDELLAIAKENNLNFLFEASVFEKREAEFMNADALCALMLEAQEKSYGDGLDPEIRHPIYVDLQAPLLRPHFLQLPLCLRRPVCPGSVCPV